jgi:hypothetical protein
MIDDKIAWALVVASPQRDTFTVTRTADKAFVNRPVSDAFSRWFGVKPACIEGPAYRMAGFLARV